MLRSTTELKKRFHSFPHLCRRPSRLLRVPEPRSVGDARRVESRRRAPVAGSVISELVLRSALDSCRRSRRDLLTDHLDGRSSTRCVPGSGAQECARCLRDGVRSPAGGRRVGVSEAVVGEGRRMKISVVGCGYLGAVHAASMAQLGHDVVGIDVDETKVEVLQHGKAPFYEPGFDDLLTESLSSGRLAFSADVAAAADAQLHFVCVGTPQKRGEYAADLRYVEAAVDSLLPFLTPRRPRRREVDRAGGHRGPAGRAHRDRGSGCDAGLEPRVPARGVRRPRHAASRPARLRAARRRLGRARARAAGRGRTPGSSPTGPRRSSRTTPRPRW